MSLSTVNTCPPLANGQAVWRWWGLKSIIPVLEGCFQVQRKSFVVWTKTRTVVPLEMCDFGTPVLDFWAKLLIISENEDRQTRDNECHSRHEVKSQQRKQFSVPLIKICIKLSEAIKKSSWWAAIWPHTELLFSIHFNNQKSSDSLLTRRWWTGTTQPYDNDEPEWQGWSLIKIGPFYFSAEY